MSRKPALRTVAGTESVSTPVETAAEATTLPVYDCLIIGAGFSGISNAVKLRKVGIRNFLLLERADEVGGTWRDTRYPGAACDVPSNLYSLSFARNANWSRNFASSAEIQRYTLDIVAQHALRPQIRFRRNVNGCTFDTEQGIWHVSTSQGELFRARTLIMASGPLANASLPLMSGMEHYQGHKVHSAHWDENYDFSGKRVAVIGTGASAIQIIPELVKIAAQVKVFQRTPGWVLPRMDYAIPGWNRTLFQMFPGMQDIARNTLFWIYETSALGVVWTTPLTSALEKLSLRHLHAQVNDPWLRRQLTPDYRIGCKRVLLSSDYYPALQQPNCELITWPVDRLCEQGIRSCDGLVHQVDCIVFATGYDVGKNSAALAYPISGLGGRQLAHDWQHHSEAYKSTTISGYPNLFVMLGPNAGPGHNSALVYMEAQADYAVQGIQLLLQRKLRYADVRADVQAQFNRDIQRRLQRCNWNSGCKSWYLTSDGFNPSMYPGFATQFQQQLRFYDTQDYQLVPGAGIEHGKDKKPAQCGPHGIS